MHLPVVMGGQELLVGVGDSSFWQIPQPSVLPSRDVHGNSNNEDNLALVRKISCGATAAFAVSGRGSLLEWGTDVYGERLSPTPKVPPGFGLSAAAEETQRLDHPVAVALPMVRTTSPAVHVKLIACGAHFVVAALEAGGCVSWGGGRDARKALGRGGCGACVPCSSSTPPVVPSPKQSCSSGISSSKPDWVAEPLGSAGGLTVNHLAAGDSHAIAVCGSGKAWAWGSGECGQLGSGQSTGGAGADGGGACVPVPVRVPPAAVVRAAACGRDHSAVLTSDGRVWTFGSSLHGQLGLGGVGEMSWTPAVVDALDGVGTMRADGSFTGMASVACGAWHTAALSTTGDVYAWGWGRFGALGPYPSGSEPSRRRKAQAGGGGGVDRSSDPGTNLVTGCTRAAGATGSTAAAEESEEGEVRPYPGLVDAIDALLLDDDDDDDELVSVSCGARYTLALSRKKRAFVWGQVAPPTENSGGGRGGGAGGKKTGPFCGSGSDSGSSSRGTGNGNTPLFGSYSTPRELKPEELLQSAATCTAAAAATAQSGQIGGADDASQYCCSRENAGGNARVGKAAAQTEGKAAVWNHGDGDSGSRWRISTAGCGPWYIVFGLEEKDRQIGGRRVIDLRAFGSREPVAQFRWHKGPITSIEWHPTDESMLVASSTDSQLTVWDLSVEADDEAAAGMAGAGAGGGLNDLPPQLLYVHQGQTDIKELHFHPQIPGVIMSTAADGFNVFKPATTA